MMKITSSHMENVTIFMVMVITIQVGLVGFDSKNASLIIETFIKQKNCIAFIYFIEHKFISIIIFFFV